MPMAARTASHSNHIQPLLAPITSRPVLSSSGGAIYRRTNTAPTHFKCKHCGDEFESDLALKAHMRLHDNISCEWCGDVFPLKHSYRVHVEMEHSQRYFCRICGKSGSDPNALIKHIIDHDMLVRVATQVYKHFGIKD